MRVAIPCYIVVVLLLTTLTLSEEVRPEDSGEDVLWVIVDVLCGSITEDTTTNYTFYITCPTTVEAGVTLEMWGMGYADRSASIDVYGYLYLSAYITWNTTDPQPDPYDDQWWGITIYPSGHVDADDFEIRHSVFGLWIESDSNTIRRGFMQDLVGLMGMEGYAISLLGNNNTVDDVTFTNLYVGVAIPDDNHGNVVRNSRFSLLGNGVTLGRYRPAVNNTIVCNEFSDNEMHIYAPPGTTGNRIHHNNFYSANWEIVLDESRNMWDDGYPNGGNYWHDYAGNDSYRGTNQDFPGEDGIGDEPYSIPSWALDLFDNYPFKNPVPISSCPYPPQEMPLGPLPPYSLSADLEGPSLSDVNVSWELSWDESNPGFGNYAVYSSNVYEPDGAGYAFLAEVPSGTTYYIHSGAGHGDSSNHFYYVQANDTSGHPGRSYEQVGKFTQKLQNGLNLISIPLISGDMNLDVLLQTLDLKRVTTYDSSTGMWNEYHESKIYLNPWSLTLHQGFWIDIASEGNVTIAGRVPDSTEIELMPGWNLVGYPSFIDREVSISLSGIPCIELEGFSLTELPYHLTELSPIDMMTAGQAYWIKVSSPCTWTVTN